MTTAEKTKKPSLSRLTRDYQPPYKRIEADLRQTIETQVWASGMILPSRRALAQSYNVSLGTLERAIAELLADGTLTSQDRRGTFVSYSPEAGSAAVFSAPSSAHFGGDLVLPRGSAAAAVIGIVSPTGPRVDEAELISAWPSLVVGAIERTVTAVGMRTQSASVQTAPGRETAEDTVESLLRQGVDGLVFVMLPDEEIDRLGRRFAFGAPGVPPAVFIIEEERLLRGSSVYYDNRDAGFHAAHHLIDQGCRSLTFVSPYLAPFAERRLWGAEKATALAGLGEHSLQPWIKQSPLKDEYNSVHEAKGLSWIDHKIAGYMWAKENLPRGLHTDGVIAVNDEVAVGFIGAAKENGLEAGRDYAIIGFDDMPVARAYGLTTMRPPLELMGEEGARLIAEAIVSKRVGQKSCLHSQLVARTSSRFSAGSSPSRNILQTKGDRR